ncbi:tyrosine-type recombinase/integrase, partial [Ectothiorhodospira shaposhnikovii]|uniref:tyrosine-type recombinase/integrase n=1 Tax=Ectothiorhodospira shaposhnikovii TaxID=1054 RepID=UPI0023E7B480
LQMPADLPPAAVQAIGTQESVEKLTGVPWLVASLLYGTGMRLMECLRLRVQDVEFDRGLIMVRCGEGNRGRRGGLAVRSPLDA